MVHDPTDTRRAAVLFKALAHPGRLEIACLLAASGPRTQKQLVDELGWPQSTITRHVAPLRACGLVAGERRGTEVRLAVRSRLVRTLVQSVCKWMQQRENGSPAPASPVPPCSAG